MAGLRAAALLFPAGVLLAACGPGVAKAYVVADVAYRGPAAAPIQRDVRASPSYTDAAKQLTKLAIRMPDTCVQVSAAEAVGASTAPRVLLSTRCSVWLGAIERAVVAGGTMVVSWDAVHLLERSKKLTPYQAAAQLGADGVLILASLEVMDDHHCPMNEFQIQYFQGDAAAVRGAPVALGPDARAAMSAVVRHDFDRTCGQLSAKPWQLGAMLDATVVSSSGEAIWFYRGHASSVLGSMAQQRFLFRGKGATWRPVAPDLGALPAASAEASSEVFRVATAADPQGPDPLQAQRAALIQQVADDALAQFRLGASR